MKNRPDKPGYWWYLDNEEGKTCIIEVIFYVDSLEINIDDYFVSVIYFENNYVDEWLGQAHPPKRLTDD